MAPSRPTRSPTSAHAEVARARRTVASSIPNFAAIATLAMEDPKVTVFNPIDGIRGVVREPPGPVKTAATSLAPGYAGEEGAKALALSVASNAERRCACWGIKIGLTSFANIEPLCPHAMMRRETETDVETSFCRQTDWANLSDGCIVSGGCSHPSNEHQQ